MAIRIIERKPLITPKDYVESQDIDIVGEVSIKESIISNVEEQFNHTTHIQDGIVQDHSIYNEEEIIDEELSICNKTGMLIFESGKSARMLKLSTPERNIDTDKIILPLTTTYMGQTIKMRVPREEALVKKGILKLSGEGANVNEANAKYHIKSLEYQEEKIGMVKNVHSELGYFKYENKEIFKLSQGINIESKYDGTLNMDPKGDLEDYLKGIRTYVAPYTNMSIAFMLGCTSALVSKLNKSNIDLNTLLVHIVGESSKGKSTATMLAISIWGNPILGDGGLYNSWNATENALITSLGGNHGVAYALDELSMSKVDNLTSLIYNITGGKDKDRLTKEIEKRKSATWCTTIISNGEASILSKSNKNTGLDIRVIELLGIEWTDSAKHSDDIKALARNNYGVFGHSFAKRLTSYPIDKLKILFEEERENFITKLREKGIEDNKIQRTSSKYALITLAGRLINSGYGMSLNIEGVRDVLINVEIQSIQRRGIENRAEDWLLQVVEANASKFKNGKDDKPNVDYWGTRKVLPNGDIEVAILKNKFEEIMKQGKFEDINVLLRQLREEGKLDHEKDRFNRRRKINAVTTEVYVVRLSQ